MREIHSSLAASCLFPMLIPTENRPLDIEGSVMTATSTKLAIYAGSSTLGAAVRTVYTGRYTQADPIGLKGDINLYGYAYDSPTNATDQLGLAVWICSRKASFGLGANHAYLWDDRKDKKPDLRSCGEGDNSGHEAGPQQPGMPPGMGDQCSLIPGSDGKEDSIFSCCEKLRKEKKAWFPGYDCHWLAGKCIEDNGLKNPGAPGGRMGSPCCGQAPASPSQPKGPTP